MLPFFCDTICHQKHKNIERKFFLNSTERIIAIMLALLSGEKITRETLADQYNVNVRTVQRDLATIKHQLEDGGYPYTFHYDNEQKTYFLTNENTLDSKEILGLSKILLASRAFNTSEMKQIINHLLEHLNPQENRNLSKMIANELLHYQPVTHQKDLFDKIMIFSDYIREQTTIDYVYYKNRGEKIERYGLPVSLYFSEYYFYVLTYCPETDRFLNLRLDRFDEVETISKKIKIPHSNRLEEGILRKKLHYMYPGKEITFTFRFWGIVEAALDKLPNSKVIKHCEDGSVIIEATSYEWGVTMWLLSQRSNVQVLSPPSFVENIKAELQRMIERYD